jgi:hypothetical protein
MSRSRDRIGRKNDIVVPQPSFGEPWLCLTTFWDFDKPVEDKAPGKAEIAGSHPPFTRFLGLGFM